MLTIHYKTSDGKSVRHTLDVVIYWCEWRKQWVAYDGNFEPDEDGCYPFYGLGDTCGEAVDNMITDWEEWRERH